jgi:hypothetical protein
MRSHEPDSILNSNNHLAISGSPSGAGCAIRAAGPTRIGTALL